MRAAALLIVCAATGLSAEARAPMVARAQTPSRTAAEAALDRRPADLVRAAPGHWSGLYRGTAIVPEVVESLSPEALAGMQRAEAAYRDQDYPGALGALYAVLDTVPDFPPALLLLGNTHYRVRRYQDSADALERFLLNAPDQLFRTQALGHDLYTLGDYEAALEHYTRVRASLEAAGFEPGTSLLRGIALCHLRQGDVEQALLGLDAALERSPGDAEALVWRAQVLLDGDRPDEAVVAARRARDAAPFEPRPWYLLQQALAWNGAEEEAAEARARWKAVDRLTQALRQAEATLLYEPFNYGEALRAFDLQAELGNGPAAMAAFERVYPLRPPEVPSVLLLTHGLDGLLPVVPPDRLATLARELEAQAREVLPAWEVLAAYYAEAGRGADLARARSRAEFLRD